MRNFVARHPLVPFVLPFAVFMALLGMAPLVPAPAWVWAVLRVGLPALAIVAVSLPALDLRPTRPIATAVVGTLVFLLWILPDQLIPGYRNSVLFQNGITGYVASTVPLADRADWLMLSLRFLRAVMVVPIVEELFFRGWLPRWIDHGEDFRLRPLGAFTVFSFVASTALFGLEHGSFWDVGIVAGAIYNWWMIKTRSLGDLIWCHAVTNALLSGWVVGVGQWQYW